MAELKHFTKNEIKLTQEQAWRILNFFWPGAVGVDPGALTEADRGFAQALLVEAIDASYNMGYAELVYTHFFGKVPTSFGAIKDIVKDFGKAAIKHWFKHATGADLKDPKIYESVRASLARNQKSAWAIRQQGGDLDY
jgi:hypothetical protein